MNFAMATAFNSARTLNKARTITLSLNIVLSPTSLCGVLVLFVASRWVRLVVRRRRRAFHIFLLLISHVGQARFFLHFLLGRWTMPCTRNQEFLPLSLTIILQMPRRLSRGLSGLLDVTVRMLLQSQWHNACFYCEMVVIQYSLRYNAVDGHLERCRSPDMNDDLLQLECFWARVS